MMPEQLDRNLLFGIRAVKMNFLASPDLLAALNACAANGTATLGQVLVDRGTLSISRHALLEGIVHECLEQHGHDLERYLAGLTSRGPRRSPSPTTQLTTVVWPEVAGRMLATGTGKLLIKALLGKPRHNGGEELNDWPGIW
jgi:hypothetical protein